MRIFEQKSDQFFSSSAAWQVAGVNHTTCDWSSGESQLPILFFCMPSSADISSVLFGSASQLQFLTKLMLSTINVYNQHA